MNRLVSQIKMIQLSVKPTVNLVITRSQIYRNFISSDECNFLSNLTKVFKVNLLIASNLELVVKYKLNQSSIDKNSIKIFIIPSRINLSPIQRLILSLMRYSTKSTANIYLAHNSDSKSEIKKTFLLVAAKILPYFPFIVLILRKIFKISIERSKELKSYFKKLPMCDLIFFTSITDSETDSILGIYYAMFGIKTVGTPRSWDNITTHGVIPWIPSLVISHSPFMTLNLKKLQKIRKKQIIEANAPNYQKNFLPQGNITPNEIRIGYACMGFTTNPDDLNMLTWFIEELAVRFSQFQFYIYQHPKFEHKLEFKIPPNVHIRVFQYESSTLREYYSEISSLKMLFAGGTSVLLDSAFCSVPTFYLNFDCKKQLYWRSALRYKDTLPHTFQFLDICKISEINSKSDIESLILDIASDEVSFKKYENLSYFIGNETNTYFQIILAEANNLEF